MHFQQLTQEVAGQWASFHVSLRSHLDTGSLHQLNLVASKNLWN